MFLLVILITIIALLYLYLDCRKPTGFPPGPKWWPILGSALELSRMRKSKGCLYETFTFLFKQYGPVCGLKIGKDRIVILNDYESIRSMVTNEDCDGRPTGPFYETRTWGKRLGVLLTDGPLWVEQRRFVLRHLREFGFGRTTMVSLIEEEAIHLVEHFKNLFKLKRSQERKEDNQINNNNNGQIYQLIDKSDPADDEAKKNNGNEYSNDIGSSEGIDNRIHNSNGNLKIEDMYVKPEEYDDVRELFNSCGIIVSMNEAFSVPVLNTLWSMIAGKRYNHEDKELIYVQRTMNKLFKEIDMIGSTFSHFPILRYIAPEISGYKIFVDVHQQILAFLNEELKNHKTTFNSNNLRDLMDAYINILKTSSTAGESYSESQLLATCMDLFMAGSETTSKALATCFLYLVLNPEIQKKAQNEIDAIVGRDRLPTLADRPRMPYNDAIVLESLRMFMGRTMSIPHRSLRDTSINGYRIPKDTMIVANFNRVLMDEFWEDPEVFRPERFINELGKISIPNQFLPFSYGKHRCIGEVLAKGNIFLFTSVLLQKFQFSVIPGENKPEIEFIDGVTISPKPYRALVTSRFEE